MPGPLFNISIPHARPSDFEILSDWDLRGVDRTIGNKVPGYRSTSTFLTTLRSNLHLNASLTSATSTPIIAAFPSTVLQHPNACRLDLGAPRNADMSEQTATVASNTIIPELSYEIASASPPGDRVEALRLIADSVAQQRQIASQAIIWNPSSIAVAVLLLAIVSRYIELSILVTTGAGVIMTALLAIRWYVGGYLNEAEKINFPWLENTPQSPSREIGDSPNKKSGSGSPTSSKNEDPIVIITKYGTEIIGALVMRVVKRERKGYVRAWTVKLRYRNKGIGRGLLEEGARIAWGKGARGLDFDTVHPNSMRVLPAFFNRPFEKREARARVLLQEVVEETRRERSSR